MFYVKELDYLLMYMTEIRVLHKRNILVGSFGLSKYTV